LGAKNQTKVEVRRGRKLGAQRFDEASPKRFTVSADRAAVDTLSLESIGKALRKKQGEVMPSRNGGGAQSGNKIAGLKKEGSGIGIGNVGDFEPLTKIA
jgi:hypothetical protein